MTHEKANLFKAVQAAIDEIEGKGTLRFSPDHRAMEKAIAAFLRVWEPKFGHVWNQASVKAAANHTSDELEGKP